MTLEGDNYGIVFWNVVLGNESADDAIKDLNTRYNKALEDAIASGSAKRLVISDYDPLHPSKGTMTYQDK